MRDAEKQLEEVVRLREEARAAEERERQFLVEALNEPFGRVAKAIEATGAQLGEVLGQLEEVPGQLSVAIETAGLASGEAVAAGLKSVTEEVGKSLAPRFGEVRADLAGLSGAQSLAVAELKAQGEALGALSELPDRVRERIKPDLDIVGAKGESLAGRLDEVRAEAHGEAVGLLARMEGIDEQLHGLNEAMRQVGRAVSELPGGLLPNLQRTIDGTIERQEALFGVLSAKVEELAASVTVQIQAASQAKLEATAQLSELRATLGELQGSSSKTSLLPARIDTLAQRYDAAADRQASEVGGLRTKVVAALWGMGAGWLLTLAALAVVALARTR